MGARYHAHGLEANRHALDVFCEGAWRDGLTARRVTVDEMFAEFLARCKPRLDGAASYTAGHENSVSA